MKRRLIVVGIVLAALAAVWFLFFRKHVSSGADHAAGEGGGAVVGKAASVAPATAGARAPRELNVLVDDDQQGTLQLEGLVLDADEHPAAGALVTVSTNPPRQVTTGEDGSFTFDKLVGRPYTLVARAPTGVGGPVTARLTAKSDPVTLRLRSAASVEVTVVTAADKKPVAGAEVELRDIDTITGRTGADGKAVLTQVAPGGYQLVAAAPGYARAYAFIGVARGGAGEVVEKETIELRPGAAVAGVVKGKDGKPIEGALVAFAGVAEWMQQADPRRDAVTTDAAGKFRFDALPAGTFRFAARHPKFAPGASPQITLDGSSARDGVDIVLEQGATIAGKVVSKAGVPVAFASVRVAARIEGWSFEDARQTSSDESGAFEMTGLPRKKLDVVGVHESATSQTVEVDVTAVAEKKDLIVTLDNDATIAGIVVDSKGEPIAEASVWASPDFKRGDRGARMEWRLRGGTQELADAGGAFVLRGLTDGAYVIRASRPGKGRSWMREGTDASSGDQNVKVVLESEGGAKGKVLMVDGSPPPLFTVSVGMGQTTPFSTKDGSFQIDDLAPGKLTLSVGGPAFERKQVEVTIAPDVIADVGTITVVQGRKILGRVLNATGEPVPNAEVTAGRRLFGNGTSASAGGGRGGMGGGPGGVSRSATSDERGEFALYGVGIQDMAIQADHETEGRSRIQTVTGQPADSTIDLVLAPFGALEGVVTRDGAPVEGLGVNVTSQKVPASNFFVQTGPDGAFRYDRLAADTYIVQAVTGQNPMQGMSFHTQVVIVEPKKTARVKIDLKAGGRVVAKVEIAGGGKGLALVRAVSGPVAARTSKELDYEIAASGKFSAFGLSFGGAPARIDQVPPGITSVCAIPFPAEVKGMGPTMEYMNREGDSLPVFCATVQVRDGAEVELVVPVDKLPTFVPPPAEPGTPGTGGKQPAGTQRGGAGG